MSATEFRLAPDQLEQLADLVAERQRPRLVDARAMAEILGLFNAKGEPLASWVLAEARADRIPHTRLGKYPRFDPEVVRDWWRARQRGPVPRGGTS